VLTVITCAVIMPRETKYSVDWLQGSDKNGDHISLWCEGFFSQQCFIDKGEGRKKHCSYQSVERSHPHLWIMYNSSNNKGVATICKTDAFRICPISREWTHANITWGRGKRLSRLENQERAAQKANNVWAIESTGEVGGKSVARARHSQGINFRSSKVKEMCNL